MAATFRMHFLVPVPDGPIKSGTGPELPPEIQPLLGRTLGPGLRYVVACDPAIKLTEIDRGTHMAFAVMCPRCKAAEVYKAADKRHPKDMTPAHDEAETEDNPMAPGCC